MAEYKKAEYSKSNKVWKKKEKEFDPEGEGYDMKSAKKAGMKPDPKTGHWGSRSPKTGQILKGQKHESYHLTVAGEKKAGYKIGKKSDGKYYSTKTGRKKRKDRGAE